MSLGNQLLSGSRFTEQEHRCPKRGKFGNVPKDIKQRFVASDESKRVLSPLRAALEFGGETGAPGPAATGAVHFTGEANGALHRGLSNFLQPCLNFSQFRLCAHTLEKIAGCPVGF